MSEQPSLSSRAATVAVRDLGRGQHDRRTAEQFKADLERETLASLRRDPGRWPWTSTSGKLSSASRGT